MESSVQAQPDGKATVDTSEIGTQIARHRKARGLTQAELAERIGISRLLLSDYERGKVRVYADIIARIALALKVPTDQLLVPSRNSESDPSLSIRLVRRIQKIERLPLAQQKALLKNIDMYLKAAEAE